jgi:hypothetical protein
MKDQEFLSKVHDELIISISSTDFLLESIIETQMKAQYGENWYEPHMKAIRSTSQKVSLYNISMLDACAFAEKLRIAYPASFVNITTGKPGGDFICNVTWKNQMANYPEYDTYTENGAILAKSALRAKAYNESQSIL